ncbi:hypothetical protein ACQFX9_14280 [Aliinostoc sp. HNIBRCY26]|uniref:hypothetical protein n=1 Tax=Aliinostoc sp. HNIBRCY26 TaxID=3418997 RepID=UPI003D07F0CF
MKNLFDFLKKTPNNAPDVGSPEYKALVDEALQFAEEKMKELPLEELTAVEIKEKFVQAIREWGDK